MQSEATQAPAQDSMQDCSISVAVQSDYVEERSDAAGDHYFFAYTVTIVNNGTEAAKLLSRHWIISDSNGRSQEIRGDGVVGERPELAPGEAFRYTSAAVIETPRGTMHGSYQMRAASGRQFDAQIAPFSLSASSVVLH